MKRILLACIFFICGNLLSQNNSLKDEFEFKKFIYSCLDSFKTENPHKYLLINGIRLILKKDGTIKEYRIVFKDKKTKLNIREYNWILRLLKMKNFLIIAIPYYGVEEFEKAKYLQIAIKYNH